MAIHVKSNVLVIGGSGAGKSSMISNVYEYKGIEGRFSNKPITTKSREYNFIGHAFQDGDQMYQIDTSIIDSIGFAATDPLEEIVSEMKKVSSVQQFIDYVVIVLKAERNNPTAKEGLKKLMNVLTCWGVKKENLIVYLTHMDLYSMEINSKAIEGIYIYLTQQDDIGAVQHMHGIKGQIEVGSFANLSEIHEDFRSVYEEKLIASKHNYFRKITRKVRDPKFESFRPFSKTYELFECKVECQDNIDCLQRCSSKIDDRCDLMSLRNLS
jgi:GTP-binding protein EngB required for normal cell division